VHDGLQTYPGLPAPVICDYLSREESRSHYSPGTEFRIGKIEMVANASTYVDCPFDRYADGEDLSEVGLERFVDLGGMLVRAAYHHALAVDVDRFQNLDLAADAVLVHTGWAERCETPEYFDEHPFLTEAAAAFLCDSGELVGISSLNIDDTRGGARPVHSTLLRAGILIAEHLCNLDAIPDRGFLFGAIPPKFKGVGTFPVMAFPRIG
jgi:arylformamidase